MRALAARLKPRLPLLLVLLGLALLLWSLRQVSLAETWAVLRRLTLGQLLLLALANGLVLLPLIGRWWVILVAQGYRLPLRALAGYRLAAFGVSYFTPGPQFGGEPVQVLRVQRRHGVPAPAALAAVTLDKALELLANFTFLAAGVVYVLYLRLLPQVSAAQVVPLALLLLAFPAGFLLATWAGLYPVTRLLGRVGRWGHGGMVPAGRWQRLSAQAQATEMLTTRFCRHHPRALLLSLLLSGLSWLALVAEFWLSWRFLGLPLSLGQAVALLLATRVALLLPSPGGLGTLEAALVLGLRGLGFDPAGGLSMAILIRARDLLLGGVGLWQLAR